MAGWATELSLLNEELIQRRDEGVVVPEDLRAAVGRLDPQRDAWNRTAIDPLYERLMALPEDAALAAREPNELTEIRARRPAGPRDLGWRPGEAELIDRLHGAWTGRAVGCALGKPVEGMGMSAQDGRPVGRARIRRYLELRGDWPLCDYFDAREVGDADTDGAARGFASWSRSLRGNIAYMEPDDDIHYTLVGLGVVEKHGPGFAWSDVAGFWTNHIPLGSICTAETQAILNYWNRSTRATPGDVTPVYTRRHRNPYREWIGAQIRADGWAYCCAGNPERAAEFAWRDASWTHERNGIYGEMLMAAMIAAAFVEKDPRHLVEIGLSEIPADCRLAVVIRETLEQVRRKPDFEACMEWVETRCAELSPWRLGGKGQRVDGMNPVHTFNNAMVCVLSLFYGGMDTTRTPAVAVMCGLDTDCNGATVGSMVGAAAGRAAFGGSLAGRLNDTIRPNITGFQQVTMRELAERTARQWERVRTSA